MKLIDDGVGFILCTEATEYSENPIRLVLKNFIHLKRRPTIKEAYILMELVTNSSDLSGIPKCEATIFEVENNEWIEI